MRTATALLKNIILPRFEKDANFKEVKPSDSFWAKFTLDFLNYEKDPKPVFAAVYSLELEDPEKIIEKLPTVYESWLEVLAELQVKGKSSKEFDELHLNGNSTFNKHVSFFRELKNAATYLERRRMIKEMPLAYASLTDEISDDHIQAAVKEKGREELRAKFKIWDEEMNEKKVEMMFSESSFSMPSPKERTEKGTIELPKSSRSKNGNFSYKWLYAIAAVLLIGFFIWQPTQKSNEELFNSYAGSQQVISKIDFSDLSDAENAIVTRGGEYRLPGLTQLESENALEAINYIRQQEFYKAENILEQLNPAEKNAEVLFFLAFAQLNTGKIERAIENLEPLSQKSNYIFQEESQFQLALGYLAQDDKASAKKLLRKLEEEHGKYSGEASAILKDMKWF
ncbi:hypothetical protein C7S20_05435 [Christiangramia fulva]|uniref:Tetratricopeptide repeat protein n=1 Tax=Christiangramia fulva TaxID=2126553 RepID=A0A2R3Z3F6_9FLAO|nr:hypothetical protein [Christiangramia fulva]AVR44752.1 hypothetical protein C7S20_05435 [Christiangramia fulva]